MSKYLSQLLIVTSLLCPGLVFAGNATQAAQKAVDIEIKTADGKTIHAKVNPQDMKKIKSGDKVELVITPLYLK